MKMIKPKMLQKGSTIAVLSPSWGGPSLFPGIYEKALENLKEIFQFNIVEYPTARMDAESLYNHPELRAKDINDAFADDSIDTIFVSIGGNDSIRILEYLDIPSILKNPKIIM
jgi:muramoyltetrapeptide carboxypeptidase LdcA involved in peptidoglycan recycling